MSESRKRLCCDFDGVIHSYQSHWLSPVLIPDPPVPGAFEFLKQAMEVMDVAILSVRSQDPLGIPAMRSWFLSRGFDPELLERLEFPTTKPQAHVYLDDRGWRFDGTFPSVEEILAFVPWNKGM